MSACRKMPCNTLKRTNTRAWTSPTSPATSSSTTYAPLQCAYQHHHLTCAQWNGFVELLPLWLAPNLVTLLGFFFILGNVALLELYIPDLVGPVSRRHMRRMRKQQETDRDAGTVMGILQLRIWHVDVSLLPRQTRDTALTDSQVLYHGQRRWKASAPHRNFEPLGRTLRVRDVKPNAPIPETNISQPWH
jgi:hypothetical protein